MLDNEKYINLGKIARLKELKDSALRSFRIMDTNPDVFFEITTDSYLKWSHLKDCITEALEILESFEKLRINSKED
jgi:hypothetical protein